MIIDSHAHYDHKRFKDDRHELLDALPSQNIKLVINIGCDIPSSKASVNLAEAYNHVYATVGVHPHDAKNLTEEGLKELEEMCSMKKVVAYGEIGLDHHYDFSPRDVQQKWFKRQLELAQKLNLPVVIHSREAAKETFEMLKLSPIRRGVIHSFSGDAELALAYVNLGFYIGIGGVITFDKTNTLQKATAAIPLSKILLETDCPFLTPAPFRGKRNESKYLTYVAEAIGKIKGETVETVCAQTTANAYELFSIH